MKHVWGKNYDGYLDYVTAWHKKSMDLLSTRDGEFGFVTTNSITQGQPVPALFEPLFNDGWIIKYAHRTFAWDSQAPGQAAVHCVIVGFTRNHTVKPRLWDYPSAKGEAVEQPVTISINAYLVDAPNVLVKKRSKPLSPQLGIVVKGSQPTDGGNLLVGVDEYDDVAADPIAVKYLRPFKGAKKLLHGLKRWCLWMDVEEYSPLDMQKSSVLRERIKKWRICGGQARRKQPKN